jgi:uncharacterized protein (DUF427 family)
MSFISEPGSSSEPIIEVCPNRVRAMFAGHVIADSDDVLVLRQRDRAPMMFFPRLDVETSYLGQTRATMFDGQLGSGTCYTWAMEGEIIENAVCSFDSPPQALEELRDRLWLSERHFEIYELTSADLAAAPRATHAHGGTA